MSTSNFQWRHDGLATAIWGIYDDDAYEELIDLLAGAVIDAIDSNPALRTTPSEDMVSFRTDEDVDDDWVSVGSAALLAGIASLGTSLAGLPELEKRDKEANN